MIDRAALPFGRRGQQHFLDDLGQRRRLALARRRSADNSPGCGTGSSSSRGVCPSGMRMRSSSTMMVMPLYSTTGRSAEKYSGTIGMFSRWMYCQISSSVQLDSGKARMLSPFALARIIEVPQFRPLLLRVPAVLRGPEREDALLRPALFLVAPRAAERRVEPVMIKRRLQRLRLHDVGISAAWSNGLMPCASPSLLIHSMQGQAEIAA